MTSLFFIAFFITPLSYIVFKQFGLSTENFEGKKIPYCLGLPIIVSYVSSYYLLGIQTNIASVSALLYVCLIWFAGLIDDRFGSRQPKGFRGHFRLLFQEGKVSTGLLKIAVTGLAAIAVVLFEDGLSLLSSILILFLLLLTPHVMNLFDTRPLRTLKVSLFYVLTLLPFITVSTIQIGLFIVFLILLLSVFEANRLAMLGDNGATAIGALLALLTIYYSPPLHQIITLVIWGTLTILAERISFGKIIDRNQWLKKLDLIGNQSDK